jgi:hypothetical protein
MWTAEKPAEAAYPGVNGKIVFSSQSCMDGPQYIRSVNPDGTGLTEVTPPVCDATGFPGDIDPEASPDGKRIAFTRWDETAFDIFVVNADGSGLKNVTNDTLPNEEPTWSPDGTEIAFVGRQPGGQSDVYVVNADGSGEPKRIFSAPSGVPTLAWSPNGEKIAFTAALTGDSVGDLGEIYTMNADGSGVTNLTKHAGAESNPDWSPDGTKIVFDSTRDGRNAIYTMNADGSEQARLPYDLPCVSNPEFGSFCHGEVFPAWSPDGTKIAFIQAVSSEGLDFGSGHIVNLDGSEVPSGGFGFFESGNIDWAPAVARSSECTIKGTTGDDLLKGTSANDVICAKGGHDILVDYKGGDDTLFGDGGKDILLDVRGKGLLKGGDANDVLFALDDAPLDSLDGQAGNDFCLGDKGDVRKNCERGGLISLSEEERKRLAEAKRTAGL